MHNRNFCKRVGIKMETLKYSEKYFYFFSLDKCDRIKKEVIWKSVSNIFKFK